LSAYTDEALEQVRALRRHYAALARNAAFWALDRARTDVEAKIEDTPSAAPIPTYGWDLIGYFNGTFKHSVAAARRAHQDFNRQTKVLMAPKFSFIRAAS